ncbi:SLAC1 family transporter [Caminibacter pacificus]
MNEKLTFNEIIETFESRWFMSVMSTAAVGILTEIIAQKFSFYWLKLFANALVFLAIFLILIIGTIFLLRLFKFPQKVLQDLQHPIAANFFAGINISFAVLSSAVLNVLLVNKAIEYSLGLKLAEIFYLFSLIIGLFLLITVPVMLIISKKVETKHALGIWFLPPVGMFVVIFAGNFLAMHNVMKDFILHFNFFLFGPASMLYLLVLSLIYYRLKFHPLPAPEVAPSFVIGLAPVGVSVIAFMTYALLLKKSGEFFIDFETFFDLVKIYSIAIYGFGFWWFFVTAIILSYYLIKHKIPYTLGFWAFVFPVAAFGIGVSFVAKISNFYFMKWIVLFFWTLSVMIWSFVFIKTIISIINKKAFIRPKVIN